MEGGLGMLETVNKLIVLLAMACTLFVFGKIFYQTIRDKYTKVKTAKARVVDKFKADQFARIYGSAARVPQYYVVFQMNGRKKAFRVSEFSYAGYRIGESGTLKYRGGKLVDFR